MSFDQLGILSIEVSQEVLLKEKNDGTANKCTKLDHNDGKLTLWSHSKHVKIRAKAHVLLLWHPCFREGQPCCSVRGRKDKTHPPNRTTYTSHRLEFRWILECLRHQKLYLPGLKTLVSCKTKGHLWTTSCYHLSTLHHISDFQRNVILSKRKVCVCCYLFQASLWK